MCHNVRDMREAIVYLLTLGVSDRKRIQGISSGNFLGITFL
jgi:hypothetical protein